MGYAVICDNTIVTEVEQPKYGHQVIGSIARQFKKGSPIVQVIKLKAGGYEVTTEIDSSKIIKLFGEQPCSDD